MNPETIALVVIIIALLAYITGYSKGVQDSRRW
jgi:hypothetical protein